MTKQYICKRCGYKTNFKSSLRNHLLRQKDCKANLEDINREFLLEELNNKPKKVFNCRKCGKEYLLRQSKWKHEKICKVIEKNNICTLNEDDLRELVVKGCLSRVHLYM